MAELAANRGSEQFARLANRGLPLERLFAETVELVGRYVGFDGLCLLTTDPATVLITHEFKEDDFGPEDSPRFVTNEYVEDDFNKLASLARSPYPVATLDDATGGVPSRSRRFLDLLEPMGYGPELRAALSFDGACWGSLVLFRALDSRDFTNVEKDFMASAGPRLAEAIKRSLLVATATAQLTADAPGIVILDARDEVESITPTAERWLEEITTPGEPGSFPTVIYALAKHARAAALPAQKVARQAHARLRGRSGVWLSLFGSLLDENDDRAAVIIEPARPSDVAPLVAHAYGLTENQRRVAELVMAGLSTVEIAQALFMSPFTVQDHLKAIFDKTGVRSRRELVAQVFYQHYLPRIAAGSQPSSSGWFNT
jgi:DNA-binding CsgD family transcriptional regulator